MSRKKKEEIRERDYGADIPHRLIEIIGEMGQQLTPIAEDRRLKDVTLARTLTLVDSKIVKALPR